MKFFATYLLIVLSTLSFSQTNYLSMQSFYKDQVYANKLSQPYNNGAFFPVTESEYDLIPAINDSSKQYYDITEITFKKHLFELKGKDYFLTISPAFNFAYGKDLSDTSDRSLFQNTRGFHIEGDLFNDFSFSTSFYENQSRFTKYESDYYLSVGELYPGIQQYKTQNAVVPGAGRTKYFKSDGFDYAYAIGNIIYKPIDQLTLSLGNNQQFVGDGHRSLLLSDNSYSAPYILVDWQISTKFSFRYMRKRLFNLLRRPVSGSVESYYESKGYSVNYFTYRPSEKINVSLFEGIIWNRGDSITSHRVHPLFYNPIPFVSNFTLENQEEINTIFGVNFGCQLAEKHRLYGQLAMSNFKYDLLGVQVGYRGYDYFNLKDFMLQVEYNYVPNDLYKSNNRRLNYSHYNLPMGHVRGNGFHEFILRSNFEYKRAYIDLSASYYILTNYSQIDLLPIQKFDFWYDRQSYNVVNSCIELGYRFNRKMNFSAFANILIRGTDKENDFSATSFNIGIRTNLINHYKDF